MQLRVEIVSLHAGLAELRTIAGETVGRAASTGPGGITEEVARQAGDACVVVGTN